MLYHGNPDMEDSCFINFRCGATGPLLGLLGSLESAYPVCSLLLLDH